MNDRIDHLHVAICIPSHGPWQPLFGLSLASMLQESYRRPVAKAKSFRTSIFHTSGSMLSQIRESLLRAALRAGATHILWLDTDMRFPSDTLRRLLSHSKAFVAANCVTKAVPAEPTAKTLYGSPVYTDKNSVGLEKVGHVGLAVALLQTQHLKRLVPPNFPMEWQKDAQAYAGEDGYFCRKWREATGLQIYIDHDLSRKVGHIGTFTFTYKLVGDVVKEAV